MNRKEGYEILAFINMYAEKHWFRNIEDCIKIEKIIRLYLPENIRSRKEIFLCIDNNWNNIKVYL